MIWVRCAAGADTAHVMPQSLTASALYTPLHACIKGYLQPKKQMERSLAGTPKRFTLGIKRLTLVPGYRAMKLPKSRCFTKCLDEVCIDPNHVTIME